MVLEKSRQISNPINVESNEALLWAGMLRKYNSTKTINKGGLVTFFKGLFESQMLIRENGYRYQMSKM